MSIPNAAAGLFYLNYINQFLIQHSSSSRPTSPIEDLSLLSKKSSSSSSVSNTETAITIQGQSQKDDLENSQPISSSSSSLIGKRKRKSERELSYLRDELKKEIMWSREKITDLSTKLSMSETQIYKWWWDQTRKRAKRL